MFSPCLSAGGLRFLGLHVPAEGLGLPSEDRQADRRVPDLNGIAAFRTSENRWVKVPPLPRGLGVFRFGSRYRSGGRTEARKSVLDLARHRHTHRSASCRRP